MRKQRPREVMNDTRSRSADGTWQNLDLNPRCLDEGATLFIVYTQLKYIPIKQEYTSLTDNLQIKNIHIKHNIMIV